MSNLDHYKDDFILFAEAGFIAINQADEDATRKLFKAAQLLNKENVLPTIGIGYLHLHKLELEEAIKCFKEVLKKEPDNEMAKALFGICKTMTPDGVTEGENILTQTSHSTDKEIKNLSTTALDFMDKFIKKEPTPAELKKVKKKEQ